MGLAYVIIILIKLEFVLLYALYSVIKDICSFRYRFIFLLTKLELERFFFPDFASAYHYVCGLAAGRAYKLYFCLQGKGLSLDLLESW